jgi:hypothetical protein
MREKNLILFGLITFFISGNLIINAQQWGEYTLYSGKNSTAAYLIDTNNAVFHTWSFSSNAKTGYSTYMMPGGTLVRTVARQGNQLNGGGITGQVQKVDWNSTVTWDFVHSSSTYCLHHDICPMANGNVLMISYEVKTSAQAIQAGCSQGMTIWAEKIIEVQPTGANTGTIVWEWHVWDHLCQNYNPQKDNYVTSIVEHPELININYNIQKDWMHVNGIDYNEELDQITFSSHMLNELYVIDHSTTTDEAAGHVGGNSGMGGDILYRWGNPAAYSASGSTIFHVVHDAHWIPQDCPNAGYLVGFNNNGISNNQSSVDLISPPYDGYNYSITPGSAFLPSTYTWRHACSGHSNNECNSQQLPNGNMLICIAQAGYIYEINSSGATIWSKSVSGMLTHAYRYTACYVSGSNVAVEAETSDDEICPGTTIQLNANATGGSTYSYSWISNPAGFISTLPNPTTSPTETTTYTVTVTSEGCSATSSVLVIVLPTPETPTITQSGNMLFSSLGITYQWFFEGNIIEGATEQSHSPEEEGGYQVQVGDENGCLSEFSLVFNFTNTQVEEAKNDHDLQIFPNPTTNTISIGGNLIKNGNYKVWITDARGKIIKETMNTNTFDLSNEENGVYLLFLKIEDIGIKSKKILLIH